jgi:cytochrome c-type biogenesis protein CcmH/NrfF
VEEDRLLKQLKEDLAGEFTPVKPLMPSWKRALWIFPLSLLFLEKTLAIFHLRSDNFGDSVRSRSSQRMQL